MAYLKHVAKRFNKLPPEEILLHFRVSSLAKRMQETVPLSDRKP